MLFNGFNFTIKDMKKCSKIIVKTLLFVILLSTFCIFYLNSQVKEFLKGSTTFTSRYEETEKIQVPNLLLCMKPGMKRSAIQRFGYLQHETYIFHDTNSSYQTQNLTIWEAYEELSYKYESDFIIEPMQVTYYVEAEKISIISVKSIATFFHGMCFFVEIDQKVEVSAMYSFKITFNDSVANIDIPDAVVMYPVSKETWYGLVTDEWPYKKNLIIHPVEIVFDPHGLIEIGIAEREVYFRQYIQQSYETCIAKSFHHSPCFPILFNFAEEIKKVPSCKSYNDTWNVFKLIYQKKKTSLRKCLKPKKALLYEPSVFPSKRPEAISNRSIEFVIYGSSNTRIIEEEVLVISATMFIGSIGGSLGLFFGFSFMACCSDLIDKFILRFSQATDPQ